jgi:fucose permease
VNHVILLGVIYAAFISLGLPDSVLGVAWPSMRVSLGQSLEAVGLITLVLTVCSAVSSFVSGAVIRRLGTGPLVMASGVLTGLALLGFSIAPSFGVLLLLAIPLGLGAGSVDAALNHFVAAHYSSRHMNWLHGCWGVGATLGPVIMGAALAGTLGSGNSATGWAGGYRYIALTQLGLALLFLLTLPLWKQERSASTEEHHQESFARKPLHPLAPTLAASLYLAYASVEVSTGLWAASILVEGRHLASGVAGLWVSCFFGSIMAGRFVTGLVAQRVGNRHLVRYALVIAAAGALLFSLDGLPQPLSLVGLVLLGLGCAPIYPSLMHETARRFDAETARQVIGRQVGFAYVGGAIVPAGMGLLAASLGLGAIMPAVLIAIVTLLVLSEVLNTIT